MIGLRAAALVLLAAAGSHTGASRLTDPHPCAAAPGFTCSTLAVPLDRSGRLAGSLELQVGTAMNVDAPRGVLLVVAGGPGQPGVPLLPGLARALGPVDIARRARGEAPERGEASARAGGLAFRPRDRSRQRDRAAVPALAGRRGDSDAAAGCTIAAVPTLLLAGDRDLSTPLAWARREAALAPRGRLVAVEGAGHGVQSRARSDAGRRAVYAFLES